MSTQLVSVQFRDDQLWAVQINDKVFVSLKRACESIGLAYAAQLEKLKTRSWACILQRSTQVPGDVQRRQLTLIDVRTLTMWLATINEERVAESVRDKVILYQAECADTLEEHFFGKRGEAKQPLELAMKAAEVAERILSLGDGMEERDELILKDFVRTRLMLSGPAGRATPATEFVTISERCMALGFGNPPRGDLIRVGKLIAAYYRRKHGNEPPKHKQFVDGATRMVNSYTVADQDLIDDAIRDYYAVNVEETL